MKTKQPTEYIEECIICHHLHRCDHHIVTHRKTHIYFSTECFEALKEENKRLKRELEMRRAGE